MNDLAARLRVLFPAVKFDQEIILRDDGGGPRIHTWNLAAPQPTEAELLAVVVPPPPDPADLERMEKALRAMGLLIAQYTGKTPAKVRADFMAIYKALP